VGATDLGLPLTAVVPCEIPLVLQAPLRPRSSLSAPLDLAACRSLPLASPTRPWQQEDAVSSRRETLRCRFGGFSGFIWRPWPHGGWERLHGRMGRMDFGHASMRPGLAARLCRGHAALWQGEGS
jgi:hypothetical protein